MSKFHVKKGDEVVVIAGNHKGRRGRIIEVLVKREAVVIEATDERGKSGEDKERLIGARLHHRRKSQQHPNGALIWLPGPIHVSNVAAAAKYDSRRKPAGAAA